MGCLGRCWQGGSSARPGFEGFDRRLRSRIDRRGCMRHRRIDMRSRPAWHDDMPTCTCQAQHGACVESHADRRMASRPLNSAGAHAPLVPRRAHKGKDNKMPRQEPSHRQRTIAHAMVHATRNSTHSLDRSVQCLMHAQQITLSLPPAYARVPARSTHPTRRPPHCTQPLSARQVEVHL